MAVVTWLHLSDLHFKVDPEHEDFNRKVVLDALWNDIGRQIAKGLKPDFIALTGDVAFRGAKAEYQLAIADFFEPLLNKTGLSKERLFVVPGNHDIDRSAMDQFVTAEMQVCLRSRDAANEYLGRNHDRSKAFRKFGGYADFVNGYFENNLTFSDTDYFFTRFIQVGERTLSLIGLNSAWMCASRKDEQGEINDQGSLLIGEFQLQQALESVRQADWRIALLHHPVEWLHDHDRPAVQNRLNAECDFVLHGHLHLPQINILSSIAGSAVYIPAGATYTNRTYLNSYNFVQMDLDSGHGKVHLRRYNDSGPRGGEWTKDILTTGEDKDGIVEIQIPKRQRQTESIRRPTDETYANRNLLPVIVVSMTRPEAEQIMKGPQAGRIQDLVKLTPQDFIGRYAAEREGWCPFASSQTIHDILVEFSQKALISDSPTRALKVEFEFHTDEFFSDTLTIKKWVAERLGNMGGLFIIDGFSLFHTDVLLRFQNGLMAVQGPLSFFLVSLIDPRNHIINSALTEHVEQYFSKFLLEHDVNLNPLYSGFIGNQIQLQRDLKSTLRELMLNNRAVPSSWKKRYDESGIPEVGFKNVILGSKQ